MARRTEVYQIRLDLQEKKQAFAIFKQLGISPAQAIRLFFKQVVATRSIPFAIEHIEPELPVKSKSAKQSIANEAQPQTLSELSDQDIFDQLNELLKR